MRIIVSSPNGLPIIWKPTGRPFDIPPGTEMPGIPAMFAGMVRMSLRYICTGSAIFSPILKATDGDVGITSASNRLKASANSFLISVRTLRATMA